jgi:glycine dehydrogenase subunit 1
MTCIYLTIYGKAGMRELAEQNLAKAHYAAQTLTAVPGSKLLFASSPRFNEFVLETSESPESINARLLQQKMIGGLPLSAWYPELNHASLWCATEQNSRAQIDAAAAVIADKHSPALAYV